MTLVTGTHPQHHPHPDDRARSPDPAKQKRREEKRAEQSLARQGPRMTWPGFLLSRSLPPASRATCCLASPPHSSSSPLYRWVGGWVGSWVPVPFLPPPRLHSTGFNAAKKRTGLSTLTRSLSSPPLLNLPILLPFCSLRYLSMLFQPPVFASPFLSSLSFSRI